MLMPALLAYSGLTRVGFFSYVVLEKAVVTGYLHAKTQMVC